MENSNDLRYAAAKKRVKQLKGFYIHFLVYVLVNAIIIFLKYQKHGEIQFYDWGIGLWGMGLAAHGFTVFVPNFILGRNWEEKKIRELMDKNNKFKPQNSNLEQD